MNAQPNTAETLRSRCKPPPLGTELDTAQTEGEKIIASIAAHRFDASNPPPKIEPILTLKGIPVGTAGNLVGLSGQAGSGKSHALAALLSSSFANNAGLDCLGWKLSNPEGRAVFYLDFEMSVQDSHALIAGACRRAGVTEPPPWFHGYNLTGTDPDEAQAITRAAFAYGQENHSGTRAVILDGIADLTQSPNDEEGCFTLIRECHALAIKHEVLLIGVLHLNPSSDFKTRGHLGSQLERKAETMLTTSRDGDVLTLYATKTRHNPIPKLQGQRFAWDENSGGFTSLNTVAEARQDATTERRRILARSVFAGQACSLTHGEAVERIVELEAIKSDAAKKRLAKLRTEGHVTVNELTGCYSLTESEGA